MGHGRSTGAVVGGPALWSVLGAALGAAVTTAVALVGENAGLRRERHDLRVRAAEADRAASVISHDIAQPLASAASLAELLAVDWPGLAESDRRDLAVNINRSVQRLISTVNEHMPRLRRAVQVPEPADSEATGRR